MYYYCLSLFICLPFFLYPNISSSAQNNSELSINYLEKARQALKNNNVKKARQYFDEAVTADDNNAMAYLERGMQALYYDKDYEQALSDFNATITITDTIYLAFVERGLIWHIKDSLHRSLADYEQALALNPYKGIVYLHKARAYMDLEQMTAAYKTLETGRLVAPTNIYILVDLGRMYSAMDKQMQAFYLFDRVIKLQANPSPEHYVQRGNALYRMNQNDKAIADYERALKVNPNHLMAHYMIGDVYFWDRNYKKAVQYFERCMEIDNTNFIVNHNYAYIKMEWKEYALAEQGFSFCIESKPERAAYAYSNRGLCRFHLGNLQGALADCNAALEMNESNAYAYANRSRVYIALNEYEKAACDIQKAALFGYGEYKAKELKKLQQKIAKKVDSTKHCQ